MLKQILIGFAEFIPFLLLVEVYYLILQKVIAFLIKKRNGYLQKNPFCSYILMELDNRVIQIL